MDAAQSIAAITGPLSAAWVQNLLAGTSSSQLSRPTASPTIAATRPTAKPSRKPKGRPQTRESRLRNGATSSHSKIEVPISSGKVAQRLKKALN